MTFHSLVATAVSVALGAVVASVALPATAAGDGDVRVVRVEPDHLRPAEVKVPEHRAGDPPRRVELTAVPVGDVRPAVETVAEPDEDAGDDPELMPDEADRVLPETRDYWAYRQHLLDTRVAAGQPVGGAAFMGVSLGSRRTRVSDDLRGRDQVLATLQTWDGHGALVLKVVTGSPADDAGVQPGDVIVQYGRVWTDSTELLVQLASRSVIGVEKEVWLLRGDMVLKTWMVPADREEVLRDRAEAKPTPRP